MNQIYIQLREEARQIVASLPAPQFYQKFSREVSYSRQLLNSHPLLARIKKEIRSVIEDDFGHGMHHSDLVCVDAGAIVQIEMGKIISLPVQQGDEYCLSKDVSAKILLVQIAGLLHDIKRKEKSHSTEGAKFTRTFLSAGSYPLSSEDIDVICDAISEHEAFQKQKRDSCHDKPGGAGIPQNYSCCSPTLISNSLYDADKFRWGPDNFTHTLWDMVMFSNSPLSEFVKRYPSGMAALERIKETFRTDTGKLYGPDFINIGIEVGNRLFKIIQSLNQTA